MYWRLAVPAKGDDLKKLKQARVLATRIAGGDATNISAVHPFCCPGSWHRKDKPRLCTIAALNADHEIDLNDALRMLMATAPAVPPRLNGGEPGTVDPSEWGELIGNIINGTELHYSTRQLIAKKRMAPGSHRQRYA